MLLQNATALLLQNATVLLQNATVITKCDVYDKLWQYNIKGRLNVTFQFKLKNEVKSKVKIKLKFHSKANWKWVLIREFMVNLIKMWYSISNYKVLLN